jgi:hypothetical protein
MHAGEIAVVRHQGSRIDCQCTRCLDGICQPEPERRPQSRGTFRDIDGEVDHLPGLQDRAVASRQRLVPCPQRSGQYLSERDGGHRKAQASSRMGGKNRLEPRRELLMALEEIDDRRGVHHQERLLRQVIDL